MTIDCRSVLKHPVRLLLGILLAGWIHCPGVCGQQSASEPAKSLVDFDQYFDKGALRFELYQTGDAKTCTISLHEMFEEPYWADNKNNLIPPFPYGKTRGMFYDVESGELICVRQFDSMFSEYVTTAPALDGVSRVFEITVRCPMPKKPIRFVLENRNSSYEFLPVFERVVDPQDLHIRRESADQKDGIVEVQINGDPQQKVDIVYLSEGYTAAEEGDFREDVHRISEYMFTQRPFEELKDRFNVRGVFRASSESGTDEPAQRRYRSTNLNATFNTFDLDRYLLVEDNHAMHRMAAQVPYDTIIVLVNSKRYGGGGIGLDYCAGTADHQHSALTLLHEFGHSFAYLADEYIGNVVYNDMYPEGIEPVEPNITRETHPERIKWKKFLTPDVELPTSLLDGSEAKKRQIVGAFEGGGYVSKGIFRPEQDCWMGKLDQEEGYCAVCADAVRRMIFAHAPDAN